MLHLVEIALMDDRKEEASAYIRTFLKLHPNSPEAPSWGEILQNIESERLNKKLVTDSQYRQQQ